MTTENYGYIIDVIADLQKRLASETSSNKYLRGELETKEKTIDKLNSQIAEQKETIETLQSTIKSMDLEYGKLVEKYNALNPTKNGN